MTTAGRDGEKPFNGHGPRAAKSRQAAAGPNPLPLACRSNSALETTSPARASAIGAGLLGRQAHEVKELHV